MLIIHGLAAVLLLGGLTHQTASALRRAPAGAGFLGRYRAVDGAVMVNAMIIAYLVTFVLGALIYPVYRLDVRIALVEYRLPWAIGLFEIKEHWAALGLAALPLYYSAWRPGGHAGTRLAVTLLLTIAVWFNFIVGHLLNNFRGL